MQTSLSGRVFTILAVMYLAVSALFPSVPPSLFWFFNMRETDPQTQEKSWRVDFAPAMKPGLDMAGGSSLLYEIIPPDGQTPTPDLSERVAASLRERVDPQGVRNLVWRPQGANRLEIQLPISEESGQVKQVRADYAKATDAIAQLQLRWPAVEAAIALPDADQRAARLSELAAGSAKRSELLNQLASKADERRAARTARDALAEASAQLEIDRLLPLVMNLNVDPLSMESALNIREPARREARIAELRAADPDFKELQTRIDTLITTHTAWSAIRDSVGDVAELKSLLRGSGVLSFHIMADDAPSDRADELRARLAREGPRYRPGEDLKWVRFDRQDDAPGTPGRALGEYNGELYGLVWMTPQNAMLPRQDLKWSLANAYPTSQPDRPGQIVGFEFDPVGGRLFSEMTGRHKGRLLTAVLDEKIISTATIQSQIDRQGVITGSFSAAKLNYLIRTFKAGALPGTLSEEPLVERTVGPQLGRDNLERGLLACVFGLGVVAIFLIGYYYLSGVVAMVAVLMNLVLILAGMSIFQATFTLPGVAGIILTIGMAVDANVLIFERLREEQRRGFSLRVTLANSYRRAASAILDSNVTAGITGAILYIIGTEDVKGFGLTLLLGIFASLFTALFVTRTIFLILIEKFNVQKLGSVPTTLPWWEKLLLPKVDWMKKAPLFLLGSGILILAGLFFFTQSYRQGRLLDIEFAGGTVVQFDLREPAPIEEVRKLINDAAEAEPDALPAAQVQSVGDDEGEGNSTAHRSYELITVNTNATDVRAALGRALTGRLNVADPARFVGFDASFAEAWRVHAFPIENDRTAVAGVEPRQLARLADHVGGLAIVLKDLAPRLSVVEIKQRVEQQRLAEGASASRRIDVDELPDGTGAIVYVSDNNAAFDAARETEWIQAFAEPAWNKVTTALSRPAEFSRVGQIDASVAGDTRFNAVAALVASLLLIVIYIWLRFNDFKYSIATIIALLHDFLMVLAAIGFAHLLAETAFGNAIMLEGFRLNLTMVTAILTVIGFSMSDTVVVFDRIRENRDKIGHVDRDIINLSINQTLSRTLLTGGTTIVTLLVMYMTGGPAIHGFTFALFVGLLTGTYSSIAIASPMLLVGGKEIVHSHRPTPAAAT